MLTPLWTDISLRNPVQLPQPSNSLRETRAGFSIPQKRKYFTNIHGGTNTLLSTYVPVCLETIMRLSSDHLRHVPSLTLRHATPSLYCACLLSHCVTPSLYCACLSENPFLTHLHSHLPLTSTATSNGSTRIVASASLLNVSLLPILTVAPIYIIYIPFPYTHLSTNHHGGTQNSDIPDLSI
jgi:hypothetical protein